MIAGMTDLLSPIRKQLLAMSQAERASVARECGLEFTTVQKIALGATPNPRIKTWQPLAEYFGIACAVPRQVGAGKTAT